MSGESDPQYLKVLATAVQPPLGYTREELKEYNTSIRSTGSSMPFRRRARRRGSSKPGQADRCRKSLTATVAEGQKLAGAMAGQRCKTAAFAEEFRSYRGIGSGIAGLSQVAAIGLQALDDLQNHRVADAATTQNDMQVLTAAEKPQAVLRDMAVAPVETLVQAAAAQKP